MARLKIPLLLLAIAVLLALNLVFPARYTLKLVPVKSQDKMFDTPLPSREVKQVEPSHVSAVLPKANRTERETVSTRKVTVQPSTERGDHIPVQNHRARRPVHEVRWVEVPREHGEVKVDYADKKNNPMVWDDAGQRHSMRQLEEEKVNYGVRHGSRFPGEEMNILFQKWRSAGYKDSEFNDVFGEMMRDQENQRDDRPDFKRVNFHDPIKRMHADSAHRRDQRDDRPDLRRVNFHDPVQRMNYYKFLWSKNADSALRQTWMGRVSMSHEVVDNTWNGWFEGGKEDQPIDLCRYVATDATPVALEEELRTCSLALDVPRTALEQQKQDLQRASRKLSVFLSALHSIIPKSFSPSFASPCWEDNDIQLEFQSSLMGMITHSMGTDGELRLHPKQAKYLARKALSGNSPKTSLFCLPHFFLAGFPKSGTTTLAKALFSHVSVSSAAVKESHWWTRAPIISPNAELLQLNVIRYLIHFKNMAHYAEEQPYLLAVDGSQSTLWDSNFVVGGHDYCTTPAAISHILPHAKLIILMREPSSRLYSYYLWSCSFKYGNHTLKWPREIREDPAGTFHREVVEGVENFNRCLETRSLYECANHYTFTNVTTQKSVCGQIGFRLVVSMYYIHIQKFLQFFPRDQFLFLKTEDMSEVPVQFMGRVTDFLGVDPLPSSTATELLSKRANQQSVVPDPMRDDTRQFLHNFFAPFNKRLVDLTGDERFLWH